MKRFSWIIAVFFIVSIILGFTGCKDPEPPEGGTPSVDVMPPEDVTPPAEVANFSVTTESGNIYLSWVNPIDPDFAGVEIIIESTEIDWKTTFTVDADVTKCIAELLDVGCTYVFIIKTYDNRRNFSNGVTEVITVPKNIPAQVTNLTAVYDAKEFHITVSWINPQDEDFDGVEIVYGKVGSDQTTKLDLDKSLSQATIQWIVPDDSEYFISVKTKDSTGNLSQAVSTTVIAINGKIVVPEDLRTGDFVLTDNTYVRKEYYSELPQEERAKIFGIFVITDVGPLILGTQFSSSELKWTTSPIGIDTNLTDIEIEPKKFTTHYTFTGDLDGSDNWEYISSIDVENATGAQVSSMYPAFYFANNYASYASLNDTDFADGWYVPTIGELDEMYKYIRIIKSSLSTLGISLPYTYDDNMKEYTCRSFWSSSVPTESRTTAYKLDYSTGEIESVDRGTNSNYVWAIHKFDKKFESYVYPEAQITSVEIPTVGVTYTGKIPVTITGNNLCAYEITADGFYDITYVSNTKATGYVYNPESAGMHNITVTCGNAVYEAIFEVLDCDYSVGDILFTDGTKIKAENVPYGIPSTQISKALAVVAFVKDYGVTPVAVGLYKRSSLQWSSSPTGSGENFTGIQGTTTSGDMDGSDNWEYICSIDPSASETAARYYPAFNFANTYGTTADLDGTSYADGWYLPTIAELKTVFNNRHIVAESLSAVGGAEVLGGSYYWSSSQSDSNANEAYKSFFGNYGTVGSYKKGTVGDVIVLKAFNSELFNNYEIGYNGAGIKDVRIATAGEGYTGELLVTITGTNLKDQSITCSDASFDNLTYLSNTVATATIDCDGAVGTKSVTFYCGNSVITRTARVLSTQNCLTSADVGNIVLSDGSFVSKNDFNSYSMTPIAVVVGIKNNGGQAIAVGLKDGSGLIWAPLGTPGYTTDFTEIQTKYSGSYSSGYTFTGDIDGSDNWAEICKVDSDATLYPAINYPPFNFANTYGITARLEESSYADGWFLPSFAELDAVYDNMSTIQAALDVVGGFTIKESYYWSSSQSTSNYGNAYEFSFLDGSLNDYAKYYDADVLVLQAFNAQ